MATQTWPIGSIPATPLRNSYNDRLAPFVSEFQPDVGPPSRWPRSASSMIEASWRVVLTAAQRASLLTFYATTCNGGALPFTLDDHVTGTNYTWWWVDPPAFSEADGRRAFYVDLRLRRFVS